jgi:hypothetical protein
VIDFILTWGFSFHPHSTSELAIRQIDLNRSIFIWANQIIRYT